MPYEKIKVLLQQKNGTLEQPRLLTADVTGDGKNDLIVIVIVNDRVLVYPQQ